MSTGKCSTVRRCFAGWVGPAPQCPVRPAGGTSVWAGSTQLWTVGDWQPHELRVVTAPPVRAAFLGACLATDSELRRALRAVRPGPDAALSTRIAPGGLQDLQVLPGSYAVVLDDGTGVHVLTDRAGLHPVFHTRLSAQAGAGPAGEGTVFASDALLLAALHHHDLASAVDRGVLAAGLFLPDLTDGLPPGSVFRGVERVGPERVLAVHPRRRAEVHRLPRVAGSSTAQEAAPALRTALLTAVGRRVTGGHGGDLSTDLSGGLDSSALAVLAARAGGAPVAVTYADPYAANDDDTRHARAVTAAETRLRHVVVRGNRTTLPFTAMAAAPVTDEPGLDTVIIARTRCRLAPAAAARSRCHLTGDGGDVVLAAPGLAYLGDLARRRDRRALRRETGGWARLRHHPARRVRRAALELAGTSWPDTLRRIGDHLTASRPAGPPVVDRAHRRGLADQLSWAVLSPAAVWGTPHARRDVAGLLEPATAQDTVDGVRPDSADGVARRAVHWHGAATRGFSQLTRALGIPVHTPFLDGQVVDVCLSVTATGRTTVTRAKPMLGAAVGDLMPTSLLDRRTKGDYTACEYHGLRANAEALRTLLARPLLADLDVLDPAGPRAALRAGLAGADAPVGALGALVAAEHWLRALTTLDPSAWWQPHPQEEQA